MKLSHKERLRRALRHEPVDRLPTQVNYTARMGEHMAAHFGVAAGELPRLFDNHLVRVDLSVEDRLSPDGQVRFDWWGAGHDTGEEGYYIRVHPLAETTDLDAYPWPDPQAPGLFAAAERTIARHGQEYFIVPNLGFALFERAWSLRGLEQFLMDTALDPGFAGELLDRVTGIQLALIERYLALGVDGAYFGDDYGAQKGPLMSPASWRTLVKPRLARLFAPFRERGLPIILHSDGQIQRILPGSGGDRPDRAQPGAARGARPRLVGGEFRRPAGVLWRHLHADDPAPGHAGRCVGGSRRVSSHPGAGGHRPAARPLAPDDDGHSHGQRGGACGGVSGIGLVDCLAW